MWVRITAALAGLAFAALLAFVAVASFGPGEMVVPTGGVTNGGPVDDLPAGPQAGRELNERSQLQRWRAETGPAPGLPATELLTGDIEPAAGDQEGDPAAATSGWLAERENFWRLLRPETFLQGSLNLPEERGRVLMQPEGREWRRVQTEELSYFGGWVIFGVGLLLALFLLLRGRIPLELGFSGRTVLRFPALDRANHWMTATSFVVLALTGLIIIYGRFFLKPLTGAGLYSDIAQASLYLHIAFALPFLLGLVVMAVLWLRQNLPERTDWPWLARFGGFLSDSPVKPPAHRFNAGQKLVFWGVVIGGLLLFLSGLGLMFPFYWTNVIGMQWALIVHGGLAMLMVGLIMGHIYIGTIGMVGAIDAMWSGQVDRNWAEEHHRLWVAELEGRPPEEVARDVARKGRSRHSPAPAE